MTYPDVDTEVSGYKAVVAFRSTSIPSIIFPGAHDSFNGAAVRARKLASALKEADGLDVIPWVSFSGERPAGFPRNGVQV